MKKRFFVVTFFVCGLLFLSACGNVYQNYKEHISELRPDLYTYKDELFEVDVVSGYREAKFMPDGQSNDKIEFAIISLIPESGVLDGVDYSFELGFDNNSYSGQFVRHPFDENYSYELKVRTYGKPINIVIVDKDGARHQIDLKIVATEQMIDYTQVLQIATKRLKTELANMTEKGKLKGEIYILFVKNPVQADGKFYWYIAIKDTQGKSFALLIDPITEIILAESL